MNNKFVLYQEVKVLDLENIKAYRKFLGVVFGMEQDEKYGHNYTIYFPDKGEAVTFDESMLQATGIFFKREDFYNGSYARVSPDGELLELHLVDKEINKSSDN